MANELLDRALAEAVNADFYGFAYGDLPMGTSASEHYASVGWRMGYDPNPWFNTRTYLEANPDVAIAEIVPLFHFLATGAAEGRVVVPSDRSAAYYDREHLGGSPALEAGRGAGPRVVRLAPEGLQDDLAYEWRICAEEFDDAFYLVRNRDVEDAGVDPLLHFLHQGWREGRDPNPYFSIRRYLEANIDVAEAGVNPFYHYLAAGRADGRPLRIEVGFRYDILSSMQTMQQRIEAVPEVPAWRKAPAAGLSSAIASLRRTSARGFYLTASHDDFTANVGGLQFCLVREARAVEEMGADHVHLYPGRPLLVTDREHADPIVGVLLNGVNLGLFDSSVVARELGDAFGSRPGAMPATFAIHSALGHNVRAIARTLHALRLERGYFWIHDYASVCAGYSLLRNDVEFCGSPPPQSTACELCVYGERRAIQQSDHALLFDEFDLTAVAPSKSAMEIWSKGNALRTRDRVVLPHCRFVPRKAPPAPRRGGKLRIAFLGYPNAHKGWAVFSELVQRYGRDARYAFYHLGMGPQPGFPATFVEVSTAISGASAMIDAIEANVIDVALVWALWPETFCFTAHEAIAGGAAVVAPRSSGNVAAAIRETGKGLVVDDEDALYDLLASGVMLELGRGVRGAELYTLEYSNMTADLFGEGVR